MKVCTVPECDSPHKARGYCYVHYRRWCRGTDLTAEPRRYGDLAGQTFGRLVVVRAAEPRRSPGGHLVKMEVCECSCGTTTIVYRTNLTTGKTTSCGCLTKERSAEAHRALRLEAPTYYPAHARIRVDRGRAHDYECICGEPATQWAYDHGDPDELIRPGVGSPYSTKVDHYVAVCVSCHQTFDTIMRDVRRAHV